MVIDIKIAVAVLGAVVLAVGVFLPIVEVPFLRGSVNYFGDGTRDGVIALALAAVALLLCLIGRVRFVIAPGAAALGLIIYDYINVQSELNTKFGTELGSSDNPFRELVGSFAPSVSYGWIVMGIGALALIVAPFAKTRQAPPAAGTPSS